MRTDDFLEVMQELVAFVRVAEAGSFSAAARSLGLTPAGVSKNVARLEAALGLRLFQRSTRRLALTEGGGRFLQQVQEPLGTLEDAIAGARTRDEQPAGTVVAEVQPGYMNGERLMRAAMVVVAKPKSADRPEDDSETKS